MVFRASGVIKLSSLKDQPVAPIESFTRFQLAAIIDSSTYRIWRGLAGLLAGWLAGLLTGCLLLAAGWKDDEEEGVPRTSHTLDSLEMSVD